MLYRNFFQTYIPVLLLAVLFVSLFSSCKPDDPDDTTTSGKVVLMYMGTDNSLWAETNQQIDSLLKGWDVLKSGHLYIYADQAGQLPVLLKIERINGRTVKRNIRTYEESNSADPAVLAGVIQDVLALHPSPSSNSFGLIVFSHASGWLPVGALENPGARSIIIDNGPGTEGKQEMELAEFANALPNHLFDYIIFDACFTAGVEFAYELRNKANYIVGSSAEIVSPGYTPYYPKIIRYLFQKQTDLKSFIGTVFNGIENDEYRSGTFSIIKTSELESLHNFVHTSCDFTKPVDISAIQDFGRYPFRSLFFDFGAYYSALLKDGSQQENLSRLIDNCLIYKANTPSFLLQWGGFIIRQHSGLTTYIPQAQFPKLNEAYTNLSWWQSSGE